MTLSSFGLLTLLACLSLMVLSQARILRIGSTEMSPFSIAKTSPSDPGPALTSGWTGFSWAFFETIFGDLSEGVPDDLTGVEVVPYLDNSEILAAVARGEVDMGHAAITQTQQRELIVDFSAAWFFTGFKVLTRQRSEFSDRIMSIAETLGSAIGLYGATLVLLGLAGAFILGPAERFAPGPIQPWNMRSWWENFRGAFRCTMAILFNSPTIEPVGMYA